ncbi:unnamed protein product [Caenorhabditis angaria]|uniref:Structural maintenance of chromosomes protein 3 n=1 Tax=Caenorhabditis angaria TaxID=860376 RepID=A0A9P1IH53_9PELO|nr:unnamed protein product [Caenorhabditis angaria]
MHIKEVVINGFRSYKDNTVVDGFSPQHNVVVGRNGSGKSNFFLAIQFVLSDEFSHLREEQRLGMLHESTGPKQTLARVEIVFDNSDRRIMAIDGTEVRVVRQVGKKKDQYTIDSKIVARAEVVNLMESAGFSRSNPYYIVKQGKINELATSPDHHRLKLLREVAGTRVYDERKEESLKILKETRTKTEKIEGLLKYIEERLKTLENEKEDLKEYQKWDKTKRSIEYAMYENTVNDAKKELSKLNDQRDELTNRNHMVTSELAQVQSQQSRTAAEKRKLDSQFKGMKEEKEILVSEETELVAKQAQLNLKIRDLTEETNRERQGKSTAESTLNTLRAEIIEKQNELETINPEYEKLVEEESRIITDVRINETRMREILAKQGQRSQFSSQDDRDKFLTKEVKRLRNLTADTDDQVKSIEKEIKDTEIEDERLNSEIQALGRQIEENRSELDSKSQRSTGLKQEYDKAINEQMAANREEKQIRDQMSSMETEITACNDNMRRLTSRPIYNGLIGIRKVLDYFRENNRNGEHDDVIEGYYGTVMDLTWVESAFITAVEVIAQTRLFYHVVGTDRVATKILRKFNEMQCAGEINFFPLNRVQAPKERYLASSADCRPLCEVVDYDVKYDKVIKSIFANVALVRRLDETAKNIRKEGFDCVTLDGDQLSRRGALTGGFIDTKRNKLEIHNQKRTMEEELEKLKQTFNAIEKKVREKTQNMEQIRAKMSQTEEEIREYRNLHSQLTDRRRALNEQFTLLARNKEPKKNQLVQLKNRRRELIAQREGYEEEIGTAMQSQLSTNDQTTVDTLRKSVSQLRAELEGVAKQRSDLEHRKRTLENHLKTNLLKKQENLSAKIDDISENERRHRLQSHQAELTSLLNRLVELRGQMAKLEESLQEYEEKSENLNRNIDDVQEQQKDLETQLAEFAKQSDTICTKQAALQTKREESLKKLRQLGALPTEAFSKYQNMKHKELEKKLGNCVNELKKYENVNKKALDQYLTASTQKDELAKRMEEQLKSESSIEELLKVLEARKYEAIQMTFKQVSKNFKDVFKKLVPGGQGKLVMQIRDPANDSQSQEIEQGSMNVVETYTGIAILVSFVSDAGDAETREMQQLSGGQKSLVALALIFAIQMCDPAPFYLFDEIDAALDAQHRKAVADMIHELSENAQFITTTFRPELLASAEKFFGVRFRNKVSHIDVVTREQAHDFVEDDQTHG